MSLVKSIKQQLGIGATASEQHHWDGSVPNQLSLKRGTPDAPGAELIKALNGVLSFPNQEQSLAQNGYVKLPGGLVVQWGAKQVLNAGPTQVLTGSVSFPVPFPTAAMSIAIAVVDTANGESYGTPSVVPVCANAVITSASAFLYNLIAPATTMTGNKTFTWIAVGY